MRFVSGTGFVLDDVYITTIYPQVFGPGKDGGGQRIRCEVTIKPLAVDEILWAAFLSDVTMGPRMRITRRINGAFQVQPLRLHHACAQIATDGEPDWDRVLDEFDRVRDEFITAYPRVADYVLALEQRPDGIAANRDVTRRVTALMASDRAAEAAAVADDAIATGESGGMSSTVDVLKYLSAYAKGPQAFSALMASLVPTHDYDILYESRATSSTRLRREHHRSTMSRVLAEMNGRDPWAIVLSARPPAGAAADSSNLLYLQAAGTAEAMVVEFCQPGGADIGAVSVRSVVGHPHTGPADLDAQIVLPRSVQTIRAREVFTAQEAAEMFERFYRTDTIGDGYVLRPVEGYTAEGGQIDLTDTPHADAPAEESRDR